jgi:hypothetical protein
MLGAQLAPWRLWRGGLGQNGVARAASLDSARTKSQGLRGLKKTVTRSQSWGQVGQATRQVAHVLELGQSCGAWRVGRCVREGQSMRNVVVVASMCRVGKGRTGQAVGCTLGLG